LFWLLFLAYVQDYIILTLFSSMKFVLLYLINNINGNFQFWLSILKLRTTQTTKIRLKTSLTFIGQFSLKRTCTNMVKEEKRTCLLYRSYWKLTCLYPSEVEIRDRPRGIITDFELYNHLNNMVTLCVTRLLNNCFSFYSLFICFMILRNKAKLFIQTTFAGWFTQWEGIMFNVK
jgi:hypothetical protein